MDIYSTPGSKIKFDPKDNGWPYQNEEARKRLEVGSIYTVDRIEVGSWMSYVYIEEYPGYGFNTVLFEDI